jgi:hypothetical protein
VAEKNARRGGFMGDTIAYYTRQGRRLGARQVDSFDMEGHGD